MAKREFTAEERAKALKNATITNNFVFSALMRNEKIAKKLLQIILGVKIKKLVIIEYEKTVELKQGKKGIRMDIYLEDSDTIYNIEMQVEDKYNLVLRARFYGSMLDLNKLEKGEDYNELPESYVIFICMFDPFDEGQAKYVFSNQCKLENGKYIFMGDKTYKVFLNAKNYMNTDDAELKDFLEYVSNQQKNNDFINEIHNEIENIKSDQKLGVQYMTLLTNYMDDLRLETKALTQEIEQKEQEITQKEQALKQEQDARKQERDARKQEQDTLMIKQLQLFDDKTVAEIYGKDVEEIATLRKQLLGE